MMSFKDNTSIKDQLSLIHLLDTNPKFTKKENCQFFLFSIQ